MYVFGVQLGGPKIKIVLYMSLLVARYFTEVGDRGPKTLKPKTLIAGRT